MGPASVRMEPSLSLCPGEAVPVRSAFADAAEGLSRGPEALAVAPDGRIAVLDSVNSRLMLLDPTGRPFATAQIPLSGPALLGGGRR